jgi:glutamate-1-semialdehyde 2,1-aminomutase
MNSELGRKLFERAERAIPGGVNSPVRSCKHVGMNPLYFERAEGPFLYDVDGKRYLDFCLSFGPHLLGHSHPQVVSAITEQVKKATSFGACHPLEIDLAEEILKFYPFLQKARLVNSGTEAVMTAVRVARGFTGKPKIIVFDGCYHGHSDGLLAKAGSGVAELVEASSSGVPSSIVEDTLIARLDDFSTVERLFAKYPGQIAAILMEPIPANYGLHLTSKALLEKLSEIAKKNGSLLIFDECISGFRVTAQGACGYYDMKPDLVTMGKIVGGGLPLAAVAGRREIMDKLAPVGDVYQAGTLSGNPLAVAAGLAVLKEINACSPYETITRRTQRFVQKLQNVISQVWPVQIRQVSSLFWIDFGNGSSSFPPEITSENKKTYSEFFRKALEAGMYFAPSPFEVSFMSITHTDEVLDEAIEKLKKCLNVL